MYLLHKIFTKWSSYKFIKYLSKKGKFIGKHIFVGNNWKVVNPQFLSIGNHFKSGDNLRLQCWPILDNEPELIIKNDVSVMSFCQFSCAKRIYIENGCLLGDNVFITDNFHGSNLTKEELLIPPANRSIYPKGEVIIKENVWIGRNCCIMPGVTIGKGCIIGANSVVTHDIPDYSVAAGTPAKVIKKYE